MSILEIPVTADLDRYSMLVSLDDTEYRFALSYNTRDAHWYLSVGLSDGTALASGIAIVADTPLLARWSATSELPADGFLMAVDTTGEAEEPTKKDFGDRVKLLWVPLEDVA